ncbi:Glycine dehydrogenase [decarboxylating] (glycine cleavage system P1 protein) [hydrothermal vent metagenome]|uniref:glycine dehydrogenase (aminomethyl-transferring) n=1 Tax=hydrothermal vent metagenome TaxID=652676 RepID=A0A3B1BMD2_9ZZZZ
MLEKIGVSSVSELFADIPEQIRLLDPLNLPGPEPELDLMERFRELAGENQTINPRKSFLGAGAYQHHVPVAVDQLLLRSEFFTCYTPYQPEVSQGTLAAIYEFQTYTAALTGMDIANASMYDGASALAEAVIMAARIKKKPKMIVSNLVHPHWREVTAAYTRTLDIDLVTVNGLERGVTDGARLALDEATAAVVVQSPNFLGNIEDLREIRSACDSAGALMIVAVAEPVSLGLLKGPGHFGADVVVAEGRSFGGSLSFGGPGLGMFAVKKKYARQMPGRLAGKTKDTQGREGYTLTLSTREQHIRRERATSNICSNQALCATAAVIHMSLLGKEGLRELAMRNLSAAAYLARRVTSLNGFARISGAHFFNEVAISMPAPPQVVSRRLAKEGIQGGLDLRRYYPELESSMLFCATEMNTKKSIDRLVGVLAEFER